MRINASRRPAQSDLDGGGEQAGWPCVRERLARVPPIGQTLNGRENPIGRRSSGRANTALSSSGLTVARLINSRRLPSRRGGVRGSRCPARAQEDDMLAHKPNQVERCQENFKPYSSALSTGRSANQASLHERCRPSPNGDGGGIHYFLYINTAPLPAVRPWRAATCRQAFAGTATVLSLLRRADSGKLDAAEEVPQMEPRRLPRARA